MTLTHGTWRDISRTQQEGYEVSCDAPESTVVPGRRLILVGQFFWHSGAFF